MSLPVKLRRLAGVSIPVLLVTVPALALAQSYETPRSLALGSADVALASGNDALYNNAAAIALGNFYSIELGYFDDFADNDRRFSSSITDGHDKRIAGGIGYSYRSHLLAENGAAADLRNTVHRFDVALAARLADEVAAGVGVRYITTTDDLGGTDVDPSGFAELTFDASLMWRGSSGLSIAVVGTNLTNSDRPELPIKLGGGIGFASEMFGVEVDVRHDFKAEKPLIAGSASVLLGSAVALRAGFTYDLATESAAISAGVGVQNGEFGADLGFRQKVSGTIAPGLDTVRIFALALRGIPFK